MSFSRYYSFIPVDTTRRVPVPAPLFTSREKLTHIHVLEIEMLTKTPVHIGSGLKDAVARKGEKTFVKLLGIRNAMTSLYIPGSSLKGVVSKNYLALSGSAAHTSELFGTTARGRRGKGAARGPCMAKIFFTDAVPTQSIEPIYVQVERPWTPRQGRPRHIKVYSGERQPTVPYGEIECIPSNTPFRTQVFGIETTDFEVGGILAALGLKVMGETTKSKPIKIGYGKSQGLGQLEVDLDHSEIRYLSISGFVLREEMKSKLNSPDASKFIQSFIKECQKIGRKVEHFMEVMV